MVVVVRSIPQFSCFFPKIFDFRILNMPSSRPPKFSATFENLKHCSDISASDHDTLPIIRLRRFTLHTETPAFNSKKGTYIVPVAGHYLISVDITEESPKQGERKNEAEELGDEQAEPGCVLIVETKKKKNVFHIGTKKEKQGALYHLDTGDKLKLQVYGNVYKRIRKLTWEVEIAQRKRKAPESSDEEENEAKFQKDNKSRKKNKKKGSDDDEENGDDDWKNGFSSDDSPKKK